MFRAKFASSCKRDVSLGRKCDIQYGHFLADAMYIRPQALTGMVLMRCIFDQYGTSTVYLGTVVPRYRCARARVGARVRVDVRARADQQPGARTSSCSCSTAASRGRGLP